MARSSNPPIRTIYRFLIDCFLQYDNQGWECLVRTPLFGIQITKNFPSFHVFEPIDVRVNRIWLGLFCRWPAQEGDKFYRFNWEKKWAPRLATQHTLG